MDLYQLQSCSWSRHLLFYPYQGEESKFLTSMMKVMRENSTLPHHRLAAYASLLRTGQGGSVTGYSLVNRALVGDASVPSDRLVLTQLGEPVAWSQTGISSHLPEQLEELLHLTAVSTFLYQHEEQFRAKIDALSQWRRIAQLDHLIIDHLTQPKWEREQVNSLIEQSNRLRSALTLPLLSRVAVPLEPAVALGLYLESCHINQEIIQENEVRRHYNALARTWNLPQVSGGTGTGPLLGQLGSLTRQQLEETLVYLDACASPSPLLQNKILVELRERERDEE